MSTPNTIVLKSCYNEHIERDAAAAITPGHLVEVTSANKVQVHSTSGGFSEGLVAKENALIGETIDDAYAADDKVMVHQGMRTDWIYGWVPAAAAAIVVGDKLQSNGDGTVIKRTGTNHVVAIAEEAVDNSGGGAKARIKYRLV